MIASLTKSTMKQYSACFKKYWNFCLSKGQDPFVYKLQTYLEFLSEHLNQGNSFSVINSYRSALNLIFGPLETGDQKIITRFLKGVANVHPPRPKYSFTWNPDPVLEHLESLYPLENLTIELLVKKLVTLMALTSASRVQTLSVIKLENINIKPDKIEIKIPERIKTTAPGRYQPLLIFPFFNNNPKLCVASTIVAYINQTQLCRKDVKNLILTLRKPIHAASSQTISRWIKKTLYDAGIDTSVYSAHSIRHASTSAAFRAGVNIEQIRNTAGWTPTSKTFFKFYNRPLKEPNDNFARAIMNLGK
ncbi:uncharacterized protein LOC123307216 isoform X1 [Coccinella septempunctata]|uniref:uncharacterized protein LOC123307216 isoform X1 n=1 Tax=Coccinella septempunctata TaxID=41139 RepID=UPI001D076668|nr:uncharacterized protein LOC123307216 isoform X1 [Coccinella septempunctata]